MKSALVLASLALQVGVVFGAFTPALSQSAAAAREASLQVGNASLYVREIGSGSPAIVLHGGPDFDHRYLLPDLDRFADTFRLIYYDQRGRGKSAAGVTPGDVTLASDLDDLDRVRRHFQLESTVLLGHSWGTVLALEYAVRNPTRVSHLILMNPAPVSTTDVHLLRSFYTKKMGADMARQREILASAAYEAGEPEAVAARYRLHFKPALKQPEHYERLMTAMKAAFVAQGAEGIIKARTVEDRLMSDTWELEGYDLTPMLRKLRIPTLVIWGDYDFIPDEIARHIAQAIPDARLVTLKDCGHFSYLECPGDVRSSINDFLTRRP